MTEAGYEEVDGAAYARLRKDLLRDKGGERQVEFLAAMRSSEPLVGFIGRQAPFTPGKTVPVYEDDFTEDSYRDPPADVEEELYAGWRALAPRVACRATFWAAVTLRHIDHGRIDSSYLAGDGSSKTASTGAQRIDYALAKADPKLIDDCVRTVMRNLSGLPEARGNRSVYVDCPFARAWWRQRPWPRRRGAEIGRRLRRPAEQGLLGAPDDAHRVTQLGIRIRRRSGRPGRLARQAP